MKYQNKRKLKIGIFRFITKNKFTAEDSSKLRGCILNHYRDKVEYHNHLSETNFNYKTPKVQYKVINGVLTVVAIDDIIENVRKDLEQIEILTIGNIKVTDFELHEETRILEVGIKEGIFTYKIILPWLALNQVNFDKYKARNFDLSTQLRNNIIEFFGSIDLFASEKVMVKGNFKEKKIRHKNNTFLGFEGNFITNVKLPDYISLGKRKSLGYGTIKSSKLKLDQII